MSVYTVIEQAYENGYAKGYADRQAAAVHGVWRPDFEYDFGKGEHRLSGYHCDQCGIWTLRKSNYCPNCGADMRGVNNG